MIERIELTPEMKELLKLASANVVILWVLSVWASPIAESWLGHPKWAAPASNIALVFGLISVLAFAVRASALTKSALARITSIALWLSIGLGLFCLTLRFAIPHMQGKLSTILVRDVLWFTIFVAFQTSLQVLVIAANHRLFKRVFPR